MKELDEEVEEGGLLLDATDVAVVFTVFDGREGESLLPEGVASFDLVGVVGDRFTTLLRLVLSAARWGSGLIGLKRFSTDDAVSFCSFSSSFSSSEVLDRRRVPNLAGDGGNFCASTSADFGRYFGSEEAVLGFLGRRELDPLVIPAACGVGGSVDLDDCSSEDVLWMVPDTRRRVTVFDSGVSALLDEGGLESPMEARGVAGFEFTALKRREELSLAFFAFLLASLLSLFMTSAKALPTEAKFRECRMELLVVGLF